MNAPTIIADRKPKISVADLYHLIEVEIAVSSRSYDLGLKADLYARMGVRELWVVDAQARTTHVHRGPQEGGWREILQVPADGVLSPVAAPDLALRIADAG